ncbi:glycosyltransferase family 4 protein [Alphaproteobacteria bacterium KMM 3653]|uniref:Glycosyltransferase family 4 protein n=1 Tax=Harenicola maris TaxID=2841044 RepID=A0AAP2CNE4_9RHOB|nr:glycosyltransferase family 4 protein [Harenicola maris]
MSVSGARCLDLSRLVSRAGRGPLTGVDRVERAYLDHLLTLPEGFFALVRMKAAYALLDRKGAQQLADRLDGTTPWGAPDLIARLTPGLTPTARAAEADLRRLALRRCLRPGLLRMLRTHLPSDLRYLNTGHSNLTQRVLSAFAALPDAQITVLIHDMIPLQVPQYQRPGTPERFEAMMRRVSRYADLVIYNSDHSRQAAEGYFATWGRVPKAVTAHLGVPVPMPDPSQIPPDLPLNRPYFVTLGTIEPRKNHALLLDAWEEIAVKHGTPPPLFIIGNRGWENTEVFARLDTHPLKGTAIFELSNLPDGAAAALIQGAAAFLFPSKAEGFGLPPAEAAALGTPVFCADLSVYREFLADFPVYLDVNDSYLWANAVHEMATITRNAETGPLEPPTWAAHFNLTLRLT